MKKRLDVALVEAGYVTSRERGKDLIAKGQIYCNGVKMSKPSFEVEESDSIEIQGNTLKYVSRGGLKLEKALDIFQLDLTQNICCDFGASTGGFTDCMLKRGAAKVYAVDVGTGQLAEKLLGDSRVVNMPQTNIRYLTKDSIPQEIDFVSVDVSFISLKLILPVIHLILKNEGSCVCLIKPQFEAGKEKVGKKGVVKDAATHMQVLQSLCQFSNELGFALVGLDFSPLQGPEGNIEYLLYIKKAGASGLDSIDIAHQVQQAYKMFRNEK